MIRQVDSAGRTCTRMGLKTNVDKSNMMVVRKDQRTNILQVKVSGEGVGKGREV